MLRRLGLENFKCWRKLDIELAPITLFFGVNSSGKSAILQSLLMLKQTAQGVDPGRHINFGGGDRDYVDLGSYRDVAYGHDIDGNFGVRLQWDALGTSWKTTYGNDEHRRNLKSLTLHVEWGIDEYIYVDRFRYDLEMADTPDESVEVCRVGPNAYTIASSVVGQTTSSRSPFFPLSPILSCASVLWIGRISASNAMVS